MAEENYAINQNLANQANHGAVRVGNVQDGQPLGEPLNPLIVLDDLAHQPPFVQ